MEPWLTGEITDLHPVQAALLYSFQHIKPPGNLLDVCGRGDSLPFLSGLLLICGTVRTGRRSDTGHIHR